MITIDINADVGEGIGNEEKLLPLISSCNIACGGHAGNLETINHVLAMAKENKIKVGAHPSYPDRVNFGRKAMDISFKKLIKSIQSQLALFENAVSEQKLRINHIKAHGALYNETAKNENLAKVYLNAIELFKKRCLLYVPFNSIIAKLAIQNGFSVSYEVFADRNYNDDLSLVSREYANALLLTPKSVLEHVLIMAKKSMVKTVSGKKRKIMANTYCVHGDTPTALKILTYLSNELPNHQIQLTK